MMAEMMFAGKLGWLPKAEADALRALAAELARLDRCGRTRNRNPALNLRRANRRRTPRVTFGAGAALSGCCRTVAALAGSGVTGGNGPMRLIRYAALAAFLAGAPLLGAGTVLAQQAAAAPAPTRLDAILKAGVLRVGQYRRLQALHVPQPQPRRFEGIDIDMAASLAKALGVELEIVKTAWPI